ncbi:cyanophycinase [Plantactinospora sp. BC1]|uniref:cyanophycinase n=1 Tax=Plantactinospora sp. BC1 TaxID=2108470 RepID=UPI000D17A71A|nr:cyanophycinase [Plantactinospora sp. BC1]AVT31672.1 cyanophycinase [Plantactinospora sp. BC1]
MRDCEPAHRERRLVIVGGGERAGEPGSGILERFVDMSGGDRARIAVIATASTEGGPLEAEYGEIFQTLGVDDVRGLRLESREQANDGRVVELLTDATSVFFTGGDQWRIAALLGGTLVDSLLHARIEDGLVLGGTSAGAAMMSSTMVLGGDGVEVRTDSIRTGPGMEFLPRVLIDMHFAQRGRLNRLLSAVAQFPHELGLGIDENTAIIVEGNRFEVVGAGSVTVIDAGPADDIRVPTGPDRRIALTGARLHVLPAGYTFELVDRRPQIVAMAGGAHGR